MNKQLLSLWIVVAILVISVGYFAVTGYKVVVLDKQGQPIGAVSNPYDVGPETGQNGLQTYVTSGTFNASTTLFAVKNPFQATSTVDLVELINSDVQAATTTYNIICARTQIQAATTTCASGSSRGDCYLYNNAFSVTSGWQTFPAGSERLMDIGQIATSTGFGFVTNNQASTSAKFGGGSTARLTIGPEQYFGCVVDLNYGTTAAGGNWDAFTSAVHKFAGSWKVRFLK